MKEEIENSERKARRIAVTEETEEEEAENIPQDDDDQVVEQQMEIDFDAVDKENGYHDDGVFFLFLAGRKLRVAKNISIF